MVIEEAELIKSPDISLGIHLGPVLTFLLNRAFRSAAGFDLLLFKFDLNTLNKLYQGE